MLFTFLSGFGDGCPCPLRLRLPIALTEQIGAVAPICGAKLTLDGTVAIPDALEFHRLGDPSHRLDISLDAPL